MVLLGLAVLAGGPAVGAVSEPGRAVGCRSLTAHAYEEVPQLYFTDDPDSLIYLLDRWDRLCGPHEVIHRSWILGAIWDGAFSEDIYDDYIVDDLIIRGGDFASPPSTLPARARYDSFTVDLADQLLPHTARGSVEEFWCLFYSGRTAEAWAALESDSLRTTVVAKARARKLGRLRDRSRWTVAVTGGIWHPRSDHSHGIAGNKATVGLLAGRWTHDSVVRGAVEFRPGRTEQPYVVPYEGKNYLSDRWDVFVVALEIGWPFWRSGPTRVGVFGGAGGDFLKPLGGVDLVLQRTHVCVGLEWRQDLGENRNWFAGLDLRFEVSATPEDDDIDLGGDAWSARAVFGRSFFGSAKRGLRALTH